MGKEFGVRECFLGLWNLKWTRKMVKKKALIDGKYYIANELEEERPKNLHGGNSSSRQKS